MNMSGYFLLDNKEVFLWGNTEFTKGICGKLEEDGYSVSGIIDKSGTTLRSIRLITLDEIEANYEKDLVVFVLCLKSALNQEELAEGLYERGFRNLIFAPLTIGNMNTSIYMRELFQNMLYGGQKVNLFPQYDLLIKKEIRYCVLKLIGSYMEVLVDIKHIRTFYRYSVDERLLQFRDKHISQYDFLNELYDFLYKAGSYPENYMSIYMAGTKDKSFIEDRKKLFDSFRKGRETYGWSFFYSIPIPVECRENGLNIKDGMHRASFLYKEGATKVPVLMSLDDFIKFTNVLEVGD